MVWTKKRKMKMKMKSRHESCYNSDSKTINIEDCLADNHSTPAHTLCKSRFFSKECVTRHVNYS